MPVLPWKQGVHGNKLTTNYSLTYVPNMKLEQFKMYASVVMVTTFPYQQVIQFIVIT